MGNPTSAELGEIMASVGLAQNFAALRALVTDGIQMGHLKRTFYFLTKSTQTILLSLPEQKVTK